ncbi:MAG: DUF192 domain-containing protein [Candidatus Humimicrobiaceae bacterium]
MKLISLENNEIVSENVIVADTFKKRLFGLTIKNLNENECFLIPRCNSIHTIGMRYSIDVVFLDRHYRVIKIINSLKPFRFIPFVRSARNVLEFSAGFCYKEKIEIEDKLELA